MDFRLQTPFSMIVASPSNSGKSTWVGKLIEHSPLLFTEQSKRFIYFYSVWSPTFDTWKEKKLISQFVQGMCTKEWIEENCSDGNCTIVLDDQAMSISEDISKVFAVLSHNYNINFIMLAQNIFTKNKNFRDASLNSKYIVLGKNPRDQSSIRFLAQQMMPTRSKDVVEAYFLATKNPYSFFLLDFSQTCPENLRMRGNIFAENYPMTVYIKK